MDPRFADLEQDGAKLDRFYIPTRYPNGLPGGPPAKAFDRQDTDEATGRVERIIEIVAAAFRAEGS